MGEHRVLGRWLTLAVALATFPFAAGCADGGTMGNGRRDGSIEGGMDTGVLPDTGVHDAAHDTGPDVPVPQRDSGVDGGPHTIVGTCEACMSDLDCDTTSYCARLVTGGRACLPGCNSEFPSCPRSFTCIFDETGTGVHANICAPVGGPCCVDEDADMYGVGVGCMGPDCNDALATVHPGRDEICDGIDTNCNMHVDEDPNDCISGRCSADGDGTYSSIVGATCHLATCQSGTTTDCALYTCHDGGAMGTTCATMCAPTGTDDDRFCILSAHCDAAVCTNDVSNGGVCDEDTDCQSNHCDNGYCCTSGQCCATTNDCPARGVPTRVCDDPTNCQGHSGVITCVTNMCTAMSGINDDTACNASITAHNCGTYNPIVCTGVDPQTARDCPTSCISDADCIDAAHCTMGFCLPDLPAGGPCTRSQDCQGGLGCVDSTCCTTSCNGPCEACNVAGSEGACTAIGAGADPAGECDGFTCTGYYVGFTGGSDVCTTRQAVSDSQASCDGARHCRTADMLCPLQLPGATQIDCNDTCQSPHMGTCSGTTPGVCDNLDATAGTNMCGTGACIASVRACVGGVPQMCMAGMGGAEICDGADNNCNGTIDDGGGALCANTGHVDTRVCNGMSGCGIGVCSAGYWDYDHIFGNGCECDLTGGGASCSAAHSLGPVAVGGTASASANIGPGTSAWFSASFAPNPSGARGGVPTITVSPPGAFSIQVMPNCAGGSFVCTASGDVVNSSSPGITTFAWGDTTSPTAFTSQAQPAWPTNVIIQVTRASTPTTCGEAAFTLSVTR